MDRVGQKVDHAGVLRQHDCPFGTILGMEPPSRTPAQVYEEYIVPGIFRRCTAALLEVAPPQPGDRVLDVACGSGVVARAALEVVRPEGRVSAIDLRPPMIEVAAATDVDRQIDWRVGDALDLEFGDGAFDIVFCQQGLQFFDDRLLAMTEMRRVLDVGGRVGVAVWQGLDHNDFFRALTEIEASHLSTVGMTYEELAIPFLFDDPDRLRTLLSDAAFSKIHVEQHTIEARFPAGDFIENIEFGYSAVIPEFSENPAAFQAFVEAVNQEMGDILDEHRVGNEIVFPVGVNLARGVA